MFNKIFNIKTFNNINYIKKQNIFNKFKRYIENSKSSYLPLTLAFQTASGITDAPTLDALNNFENGLSLAGLKNKIYAYYPFIGGDAITHKFNFMDVRDLDAAYRLTFNGGWTHSTTGALPNAVNAYANTYYTPSVSDLNSFSVGYYSRTNSNAIEVDIGSIDGTSAVLLSMRGPAGTFSSINSLGFSPYIDTDSLGMYIVSRTSSILTKSYKNGVDRNSDPTGSISTPTQSIYLGAWNNIGTAAYFSSKECASAFISSGLTPTESITLSGLINTLQTALGRNVY